MIKKSNNKSQNKRKKFLVHIFVPLLLLLFWFCLTVSYIIHMDTAFSLLSNSLPKKIFTNQPSGKLLKGNYISGEFVAEENNLGILSLRFETFFRPEFKKEDSLLFQIKEKGSKDWFYENEYRNGLIYEVPFFPFGFPIIPDSKDKIYEFKITSLKGDVNNSVALSNRWQNISAKYKYSKAELLSSKVAFLEFSFKKFISSFESIDVLFSSFVYLLPLFIYYLLLLSPIKRYLERPKNFLHHTLINFTNFKIFTKLFPKLNSSEKLSIIIFDSIVIVVILVDGLYLQLANNIVYLLIPLLWIIIQKYFKFNSDRTFILGFILLLIPPLALLLNNGQVAENVAIWAYLFLSAGIIQTIYELRFKNNN